MIENLSTLVLSPLVYFSSLPLSLSFLPVSVSGGWVAAVSHVSFDLCPIFDIENNWNGVLEQSKKSLAEAEGRIGRKMGRM